MTYTYREKEPGEWVVEAEFRPVDARPGQDFSCVVGRYYTAHDARFAAESMNHTMRRQVSASVSGGTRQGLRNRWLARQGTLLAQHCLYGGSPEEIETIARRIVEGDRSHA